MSREKFDNFHEEVLNLPRESFNINEVKIRGLAEYLFAIKESIPPGGLSFPKIYNALHLYLRDSDIVNPNPSFESLFNLNLSELRSIETHYDTIGRSFRQWMAVALFLGLIRNAGSKKIISEFTKEINNISSNNIISDSNSRSDNKLKNFLKLFIVFNCKNRRHKICITIFI
mgnify:CR=1 FL=1